MKREFDCCDDKAMLLEIRRLRKHMRIGIVRFTDSTGLYEAADDLREALACCDKLAGEWEDVFKVCGAAEGDGVAASIAESPRPALRLIQGGKQ